VQEGQKEVKPVPARGVGHRLQPIAVALTQQVGRLLSHGLGAGRLWLTVKCGTTFGDWACLQIGLVVRWRPTPIRSGVAISSAPSQNRIDGVGPLEVESLVPDESNGLAVIQNSSHTGDALGLLPESAGVRTR